MLLSIAGGLISVLAVAGGLVTRALRHAVVRRDGREIGRVRSVGRFLIAWSPIIASMVYVGNPMFRELRAMSPDAAYAVGGLALMAMAVGGVWTVAAPGRGPHDRLARTWVVPRSGAVRRGARGGARPGDQQTIRPVDGRGHHR